MGDGSARGSENSIGPVVPRCTADLLQEGLIIVADIVKAGTQGDLTDGKISFCQEAAALHDPVVHDVLERGLVMVSLKIRQNRPSLRAAILGKLRKEISSEKCSRI